MTFIIVNARATEFALLLGCLFLVLSPDAVETLSSRPQHNTCTSSRRDALNHFAKAVVRAAILPPAALLHLHYLEEAQAACLPGDLSSDCIGVYKIPLQDAISSPLLNTPEALKEFAPDVNYVKPAGPPKSVKQAKEVLQAQRAAADDIRNVVLAGRLEEAGIKVLNLVPKITGAGFAIQQEVLSSFPEADSGANQMRVLKFQQQLQELISLWSQVDIEIGQGLRGQLGVSAVAQLEIIESIKDATVAFDEFLLAVDAYTAR